MKSYLNTKKQTGVGEKLHLPDCLLACSFGAPRNEFTIENLNSSRWALADKFGSIFCDRIQSKKLSFQFTCPFGQVQYVFCLSEPQNYLSKNRQPQQY